MRASEFECAYTSRWTYQSPEILTTVEQHEKVLHCLSCRQEKQWGLIHATRLYITYEDDPLKNFPSILRGRCAYCNHEELIAMGFNPEAQAIVDQLRHRVAVEDELNRYRNMALQQAGMLQQQQHDLLRQQQQLDRMRQWQQQICPPPKMLPYEAYGLPPNDFETKPVPSGIFERIDRILGGK